MPKSSAPTILILEDEPLIRSLLQNTLSSTFEVLTAATVAEALNQFRRFIAEIKVLVTDLRLPDGSGLDVALEFSRHSSGLRTVLISGYPPSMWNEIDTTEFEELPPNSVTLLQKPFLPSKLIEVLNDLIGVPEHRSNGACGGGPGPGI